jgi:hypothetical protein
VIETIFMVRIKNVVTKYDNFCEQMHLTGKWIACFVPDTSSRSFCLVCGGAGDGVRRCAAHSRQQSTCACNWYAIDPGGLFCAMRDFCAGADDDPPGELDLGEGGVATHSIPACSAFKVPSL